MMFVNIQWMRLKLYSRINHDNQGLELQWKPTAQIVSKVQGNRLRKKQLRFESLSIPLWVLYRAAKVTVKKVVEYLPAFTKWGKALFVSRYRRRHWMKRSQAGMHWTMARTPYVYLWQNSGSVKISKKKKEKLQFKRMNCSHYLVSQSKYPSAYKIQVLPMGSVILSYVTTYCVLKLFSGG